MIRCQTGILSSRWDLLLEGKGGETPDIVRTGLDQAGRFKPSLSDIKKHH